MGRTVTPRSHSLLTLMIWLEAPLLSDHSLSFKQARCWLDVIAVLVVPPFDVTTMTVTVFFALSVLERRANKQAEEGGHIKVQWQSPQLSRQSLCTSANATHFNSHSNKRESNAAFMICIFIIRGVITSLWFLLHASVVVISFMFTSLLLVVLQS